MKTAGQMEGWHQTDSLISYKIEGWRGRDEGKGYGYRGTMGRNGGIQIQNGFFPLIYLFIYNCHMLPA